MKITVQIYTNEKLKQRNYSERLNIIVDGKSRFNVYDGEPEDANLSRDFSDCWSIPKMMREAHEAGKRGEDFIIEELELDEF